MTDEALDPDLQSRLKDLAEARVREQVAAAKQRAVSAQAGRAAFAEARGAGLRSRHSAKQARLRLAEQHDRKGQQ